VSKTGVVTKRYNYGKVICIFLGCVYLYVIVLTFLGPENRGGHLDVAHDADLVEAAPDAFEAVIGRRGQGNGTYDEENKGQRRAEYN